MADRPDAERVARVLADLPDEEERSHLSSGYRISDRLVLTTAHGLEHGTAVVADLGGDAIYRPVTCVWLDRDLDLALLRFDTAPMTGVEPVRLGAVDRGQEREVAARAVGHPRWAEVDRSSERDPDAVWRGRTGVRCAIRPADAEAPGMLRVRVRDAAPAPTAPDESPWTGMSGAAVRTEESGLLVGVVRDHVPAAGVGMLQVTALDRVDDAGWRTWLSDEGVDPRPLPALPDGWDRTRPRALRQHHAHVAELRRDLRPLVPEKLPYVDPGGAGAPAAVLARLAELADSRGLPAGLIVVGEPGAGKTRLCLETAALAEDSREWLVVHLTEGASLTDVWSSVRGLADRVLVVADEIDWIADPGTTYNTVFTAAAGSDVRLALLTTARRLRLDDLATGALNPYNTFETVQVRWDREFHRAVSRQMVRSLARDAVREGHEERLLARCLGPPAASQLCATYYGNRARAKADLTDAVPSPTPEFGNWLHAILLDMGLPAAPRHGDPEPATVAAAQIVVHAPCRLDRALDFFAPGPDHPDRAASAATIERLVVNGLLHAQDDALRPAHDVYADGILGHAVLEAGRRAVHPKGLRRLLDTGLVDGPALVRVVTAVDRLCLALDATAGEALARAVDAWCVEHRDALRALVLPDPRGAELRALLTRRTWRAAALRDLAEPWLDRHHNRAEARDAVLTAARHLPPETSRRYLFEWIYDHGQQPQAALAYQQALDDDTLDPATREWTADQAYAWLADNAHRLSASRPLRQLLDTSKRALPVGDPRVEQLLTWALRWLRRYGTRRRAGFVARPLVLRPELTGADLTWTARLLLDTVAPDDPPSATFALEAVLARHRLRRDLHQDVFKQAVRDAFAWLEDDREFGLLPAAAYLLKELVVPGLPGRDALPRAVQAAWKWVARNPDRHHELGRVLPPLLKNASKSLPGQSAAFVAEEREQLGRLAVDWLAASERTPEVTVSEVLGAFLGTSLPDADPARLRWLADRALDLLGQRPNPTVARSVLTPLLRRKHLDADLRQRVIAATFDQLPPAPPSVHMAYPLTELVRRRDLTDDEYRRAMAGTLQWLGRYPRAQAAAGLLARALGNRRTTRDDCARLAARAVQVLTPRTLLPHPGGRDPWLVNALLRRRADIRTEWNRFVARACDLVRQERQPRVADRVLRPLLQGADQLDGPALDRLHATCVDWCEVHDRTDAALRLLVPVLDDPALSPAVRRHASRVALRRLRPGAERNSANGRLLATLVRAGGLPDADDVDRVLDVALDWLETQPGHHSAVPVLLVRVAHRLEHTPGGQRSERRLRRAVERLDSWLRDHPDAEPEQRATLERRRRRLAGLLDAGAR